MNPEKKQKTFLKALGPGLLWAGAAVGVSHLVQSTRAGANYGFALLGVVVVANIFKYPAFSFAPRYAAATGTSLLEGYRRRGRWALVLYALLTLGTMFTVQAAVTMVTAALGARTVRWSEPLLGLHPVFWLSAFLTAVCAGLLVVGRYRWLDKIVKVVIVVLTLSTFSATALALGNMNWGTMTFLPTAASFRDIAFLVALLGWMPSAFDISIWHSLWTIARRKETKHAPSVREAMLDFNIGYFGTVLLALCFLTLGAGVMFGSGKEFSASAIGFADQVVSLYTENLGAWSEPIILIAALTVMFSTTLTVVDGFPRAIASLAARFKEPEVPDRESSISRPAYWVALAVLGSGALTAILIVFRMESGKGAFKTLVDLATTLSFITAPALAWLNHRAITGPEVPAEHRPRGGMVAYSWISIVFWLAFALYFLTTLV